MGEVWSRKLRVVEDGGESVDGAVESLYSTLTSLSTYLEEFKDWDASYIKIERLGELAREIEDAFAGGAVIRVDGDLTFHYSEVDHIVDDEFIARAEALGNDDNTLEFLRGAKGKRVEFHPFDES